MRSIYSIITHRTEQNVEIPIKEFILEGKKTKSKILPCTLRTEKLLITHASPSSCKDAVTIFPWSYHVLVSSTASCESLCLWPAEMSYTEEQNLGLNTGCYKLLRGRDRRLMTLETKFHCSRVFLK